MDIPGYKYIGHKIIHRPWGIECRFTVSRKDCREINDIVMLSDGKEDEKQLADLILTRLLLIDVSLIPLPVPEFVYTKNEIEALLVQKGYLSPTQKLEDLKPIKGSY
jgi:hypothetical protein